MTTKPITTQRVADLPRTIEVRGRTLKFLLAESEFHIEGRTTVLREAGWKHITTRVVISPRYGRQLAIYADGRGKTGKWWIKAQGTYYIVHWHQAHGRMNGWDLVYATNKREAREIYHIKHYSPIDGIIAEGATTGKDVEGQWYFDGITEQERETARVGGIADIEAGT